MIIPVYNVEKYLKRCVESIMLQTYGDFEILLVDDGSTDGSGRICDELALQDRRIHTFHKRNEGVSSARNLGIRIASGDYICFVDSDDWLDIDYFEKVVPVLIKEHPMLLINNYVKDDGKGHTFCKFAPSSFRRFIAEEAFFEMVTGFHFGWESVASFYEKAGCKKVEFDTHIDFGEDLLFRFQFTKVNKGLYIYQYLPKYHYFTRIDSAVNSYAIYKKIDDLKVFKQVMFKTDDKTRRLLFGKEYIPRLVHYFMLGNQSKDYRDTIAAKELQKEIRRNIWQFCKEDTLGLFMKSKLIVCLLPQTILKFIWRGYHGLKNIF